MTNSLSPEVRVGLIQMSCEEDPKKNLDKALTRVSEAARGGAQIICLQELFLSRYFCQTDDSKYFQLAQSIPNPAMDQLSRLAKEKQVVLVASLFEKEGEAFFNSAVVLDADGAFLGKYRKVHVPDDPQNYYSERFYFSPGNLGFKPFVTRYATIGVQICWDQWFPEGARALALQGAEILFYPTAIGWPQGIDADLGETEYQAWLTVQQGHAIMNTVFVAAANRTGREDHIRFWGSSFVSDPFGKILKKGSHDREEILIVACDRNRIAQTRKDWPFLSCRRTEAYEPIF